MNRTYAELAAHYGTSVLAARPYRPRDKAKVEACVGIVERWLFGRLRNRVWYGLDDLRAAMTEMMTALNARVMRRFGRSRRELFEEIDRPLLKALPAEPYVLAEWRRCKVGIDYHVEAAKHFYSVPYSHARAQVEVRLTARTVEIFLRGERVASHMRGSGNSHHTTINDHMPSSHRRYGDWTVERVLDEAGLPQSFQRVDAGAVLARLLACRWRSWVALDATAGRNGNTGYSGSSGLRTGQTGIHIKPHLLVIGVSARHRSPPRKGKNAPGPTRR